MVSHSKANSIIAAKRTRSTNAPITSAAVIAAKVIWNAAKTNAGVALAGGGKRQDGGAATPGKADLAQPPKQQMAATECKTVIPADPAQDRDRGNPEHLAHYRQQVFRPDQPAVEQG